MTSSGWQWSGCGAATPYPYGARRFFIGCERRLPRHSLLGWRNIRRHAKEAIEKFVKDGEVGEDDGTRGEKDLEQLTKKFVDQVDDLVKHKEAELLEV